MSTYISCNNEVENVDNLHFMPCNVSFHGNANVNNYFQYTEDDNGILSASFRGRPLLGKQLHVPEKFKGFILKKTSNHKDSNENRAISITHTFNKFMYWNLDLQPSANDTILSALDWLDISEAVHSNGLPNKHESFLTENIKEDKKINKENITSNPTE